MQTRTVVVVADSHWDESSRFEECIRLHNEIADWIRDNEPDLLVHCGDIFDRKSTPLEREAVAEWLQTCAAWCPIVLVGGNHDSERDVEFLSRLRSGMPIRAFERPEVIRAGGVQLSLLPWPRKANLLASLGNVSAEQAGLAAQEALRNVLRGLYQPPTYESPRLFVGHVMMRGSVTSLGQPLVGMDMELGLDDLALVDADAYAIGHIHRGQSWTIGEAPCFYPGSPRRTAFGELEAKGFTVVRFRDGIDRWEATTEFLELSATPMLQIESTWQGDFTVPDADVSAVGAEIRFRYRVDSDKRDAALAAAKRLREYWLAVGAASVKLEQEVIAVTRSRAPEVAKASSLREQLEELWRSKGFEPGNRREPLLDKLVVLEGANL